MTQPTTILGDERQPGHTQSAIHVQLLHVLDCRNVDQVRATLRSSLAKTDARIMFRGDRGPVPVTDSAH